MEKITGLDLRFFTDNSNYVVRYEPIAKSVLDVRPCGNATEQPGSTNITRFSLAFQQRRMSESTRFGLQSSSESTRSLFWLTPISSHKIHQIYSSNKFKFLLNGKKENVSYSITLYISGDSISQIEIFTTNNKIQGS